MSAAEWFVLRGTQQAGPFTREQIGKLYSSASIQGDTLVWRPGCADWMPLTAFTEFDAQRPTTAVLQRSAAVQDVSRPVTNPGQWADVSPHPWRRYFARHLDYAVWGSTAMFTISIGLLIVSAPLHDQFKSLLSGPTGELIGYVLALVLAAIINAFLIGLTGGNLGKWLFGVRVLNEAGRPIGLIRSFQRELRVLVFGLGLGVPIIALATLLFAYQKLKADKVTSWDRALALKVVHREDGVSQNIGFIMGIIWVMSLSGGLIVLTFV